MSPECYNRLFGRGKNPWNQERTPGGSSGGEAGLIAAKCSPFGFGTDIGGKKYSLYFKLYHYFEKQI